MNQFRLDGEIALITGGGTGIGLGVARCFVNAGAKVVIVGRREDVLKGAVSELGSQSAYVAFDITALDRLDDLAARAREKFGELSILVNNAGIHLKKTAVETRPEEFMAVMQTHVNAAFALSRTVLPAMLERAHGSILFTASMTSLMGVPMLIAYSAAKSAYLGMTRTLCAEVSASGVRVNAIAPGWIETPMLEISLHGDPEKAKKILGRTPMNRFGDVEDIGWAAVYLCSPAAKFVTGTLLCVDGGASVGF